MNSFVLFKIESVFIISDLQAEKNSRFQALEIILFYRSNKMIGRYNYYLFEKRNIPGMFMI